MIKLIDLFFLRNFSYGSPFGKRSLNVREIMNTLLVLSFILPFILNLPSEKETCPSSNNISDVSFPLNSTSVPCILSNVDVKPTAVI